MYRANGDKPFCRDILLILGWILSCSFRVANWADCGGTSPPCLVEEAESHRRQLKCRLGSNYNSYKNRNTVHLSVQPAVNLIAKTISTMSCFLGAFFWHSFHIPVPLFWVLKSDVYFVWLGFFCSVHDITREAAWSLRLSDSQTWTIEPQPSDPNDTKCSLGPKYFPLPSFELSETHFQRLNEP